jgi:hypothetical protein
MKFCVDCTGGPLVAGCNINHRCICWKNGECEKICFSPKIFKNIKGDKCEDCYINKNICTLNACCLLEQSCYETIR